MIKLLKFTFIFLFLINCDVLTQERMDTLNANSLYNLEKIGVVKEFVLPLPPDSLDISKFHYMLGRKVFVIENKVFQIDSNTTFTDSIFSFEFGEGRNFNKTVYPTTDFYVKENKDYHNIIFEST